MDNGYISVEDLKALHERALQELPRRVELFSRHTPIDAHAKTSIPATLITTLETLSFLNADGKRVPIEKVNDYLDTFDNKSLKPHLRNLARELAGWVRMELHIPNTHIVPPRQSLADKDTMRSIVNYTNNAEASLNLPDGVISLQTMGSLLIPIATRIIAASKAAGIFYLSDEEREILSTEIISFSLAKPHSRVEEKTHDTYAYRTDIGRVSGNNLMNAYHHMIGCAGSQNYRHAVGAIFKQLADEMNKKIRINER